MDLKKLSKVSDSVFLEGGVTTDGKIVRILKLTEAELSRYEQKKQNIIKEEEEKIQQIKEWKSKLSNTTDDNERKALEKQIQDYESKLPEERIVIDREGKPVKTSTHIIQSGKGCVDLDRGLRYEYTDQVAPAWKLKTSTKFPSLDVMLGKKERTSDSRQVMFNRFKICDNISDTVWEDKVVTWLTTNYPQVSFAQALRGAFLDDVKCNFFVIPADEEVTEEEFHSIVEDFKTASVELTGPDPHDFTELTNSIGDHFLLWNAVDRFDVPRNEMYSNKLWDW